MNTILEVKNFSVFTFSRSCKVGTVYNSCNRFSNLFSAGIYWLQGEIDAGGWAFAYTLTSSDKKTSVLMDETEYIFKGKPVSLKNLQNDHAWYLGEYDKSRRKTVRALVEQGLQKSRLPYSADDIRQMFRIDEQRFERNTRQVGFELFSCRAAIGFANGKDIYTFPWLSKGQQVGEVHIIKNVCRVLREHQKLVLIPAYFLEDATEIADYTCNFEDKDFYTYW